MTTSTAAWIWPNSQTSWGCPEGPTSSSLALWALPSTGIENVQVLHWLPLLSTDNSRFTPSTGGRPSPRTRLSSHQEHAPTPQHASTWGPHKARLWISPCLLVIYNSITRQKMIPAASVPISSITTDMWCVLIQRAPLILLNSLHHRPADYHSTFPGW